MCDDDDDLNILLDLGWIKILWGADGIFAWGAHGGSWQPCLVGDATENIHMYSFNRHPEQPEVFIANEDCVNLLTIASSFARCNFLYYLLSFIVGLFH